MGDVATTGRADRFPCDRTNPSNSIQSGRLHEYRRILSSLPYAISFSPRANLPSSMEPGRSSAKGISVSRLLSVPSQLTECHPSWDFYKMPSSVSGPSALFSRPECHCTTSGPPPQPSQPNTLRREFDSRPSLCSPQQFHAKDDRANAGATYGGMCIAPM